MPKRIVLLLFVLAACTFGVQAFNFEPITQDFSPSGRGSNQIFRVANPGNEKIAVKISIRPRSIEPDGTEIQGDPSSKFTIYPRQIILNPGESRSIRVKWTGEPDPAAELPFRIIAEQIPVAFTEAQPVEGGQITLTYRYEGNIYVVPPGTKPELSLKSADREIETEIRMETVTETVTETVEGEEIQREVERQVENRIDHEFLVLRIENSGTRHMLLGNLELKLKRDQNDSGPIILEDDDLRGVAGENMLADSIRVFRIPMPDGIWDGPIYGSIRQIPAN